MTTKSIPFTISLVCLLGVLPAALLAQGVESPDANIGTITTTTVTNATGTIAQLNYGVDGEIAGFLVGSNTLLEFPTIVAGGLGTLGAVGNSVTYSGSAFTGSSGFQTVVVSSFTNNTTKATYTPMKTLPAPTAYGPTTGTVKQLNYDGSGSIDGFVFASSSGASVLVVTGSQASATLAPVLKAGTTVTVTGTVPASAGTMSCVPTGALTVVNVSSLTVGSQTFVFTGGRGPSFGGGHR